MLLFSNFCWCKSFVLKGPFYIGDSFNFNFCNEVTLITADTRVPYSIKDNLMYDLVEINFVCKLGLVLPENKCSQKTWQQINYNNNE